MWNPGHLVGEFLGDIKGKACLSSKGPETVSRLLPPPTQLEHMCLLNLVFFIIFSFVLNACKYDTHVCICMFICVLAPVCVVSRACECEGQRLIFE